MTKRVLIVAPDFAPSSLPPALRVRFFAAHLPAFGWDPIVLTVDPGFYEAATDPEVARLVPDDVRVVRTPALGARATRRAGIGDIGLRSLWHHRRAMRDLIRRERIDLVFVSVPPSASMLLGRVARRLGVPYVIDYIDPWRAPTPYWKLPRDRRPPKWPLAAALARAIEPSAVRHAAHLTGVSEGTLALVTSRYPGRPIGTTEIPYGGEVRDFEYLRAHPRAPGLFDPHDGRVHLTYTGACIPAMTGTLRALFAALGALRIRRPELMAAMRLHFVGTTYAPGGVDGSIVMPLAREMGVADLVEERQARVSYLDALQVMLDSTGLLVLGSDAPHYTASKVFPCILARKPLLAVFHQDSSVVRILEETSGGTAVTFGPSRPVAETAPAIEAWVEAVGSHPESVQPHADWERFERYTTRAMAGRLARVFDAAAAQACPSVLVLFNTVALYGMERGVIEHFDLLRSDLRARFLVSRTIERLDLPVFRAIRAHGFDYGFFSDRRGWPKIGRPRSLRHLWALLSAMVRGNADVWRAARGHDAIYAPSVSYLYFALLAIPWFRMRGRRVIYHFHDLTPHPGWLLRLLAPCVTDVLHNTEEGRRGSARAYPSLRRARHVVIPSRTARRREALPAEIAEGMQGAVNLVFIGQVSRHKGIDLLVEACAIARFPEPVRLHVFGEAADPALIRTLRARAAAAGVDVRWWGYVESIPAVLERADVYVHPTPPGRMSESFGRGIAEAMAAGVPAVCFRSGAIPELVTHGETGWLCEREEAGALAEALCRLVGDPILRRTLGGAARRRYESAYSDAAIRRASEVWLAGWRLVPATA